MQHNRKFLFVTGNHLLFSIFALPQHNRIYGCLSRNTMAQQNHKNTADPCQGTELIRRRYRNRKVFHSQFQSSSSSPRRAAGWLLVSSLGTLYSAITVLLPACLSPIITNDTRYTGKVQTGGETTKPKDMLCQLSQLYTPAT